MPEVSNTSCSNLGEWRRMNVNKCLFQLEESTKPWIKWFSRCYQTEWKLSCLGVLVIERQQVPPKVAFITWPGRSGANNCSALQLCWIWRFLREPIHLINFYEHFSADLAFLVYMFYVYTVKNTNEDLEHTLCIDSVFFFLREQWMFNKFAIFCCMALSLSRCVSPF